MDFIGCGFCCCVVAFEDVACAAAADVGGAVAWSACYSAKHQDGGSVCFGVRVCNLRLDILTCAGLDGIGVLGHVAGTAAAGCDYRGLECWCLEVLGLDLGRLGGVYYVPRSAAAR